MNVFKRNQLPFLLAIGSSLALACPVMSQDRPISDRKTERTEKEAKVTTSYKDGVYCTERTIKITDSFDQNLVGPKEALNEIVYPGALIYMDDFLDGSYNVVPCRRSPITVYSDFYDTAGEDSDISEVIDDVSSSGIAAGVAALVNRKGTTQSLDSDMQIAEFYSNDQLGFELNASASYGGFSGSGSFGFTSSDEKQKIVAQFMQRYFAVRVDGSKFPNPGDWFESDEEAQRILGKKDRGPLLYISSVIYGRCLYFGIESSLSEKEINAALTVEYDGTGKAKVDSTLDVKKMISESKVKYVSIGGSVESGPVKSLDDFLSLIGESPSNLNAGGPIAYVFRFVDSNKVAFVNMATEFTERKCIPVRKGLEVRLAKVINRGNDCELTDGTGCTILVLAPLSTKALEEYCKQDNQAGVDLAGTMWEDKGPLSPGRILRQSAPQWAKSMKGVGLLQFGMKQHADYWEVFEGSNENLISGKFVDYFGTVPVVDDPETMTDERNEIGFCILSTFCEDGERFSKIEFAKLSELRALGTKREFTGVEQDLGSGDGWMRYGLTFEYK